MYGRTRRELWEIWWTGSLGSLRTYRRSLIEEPGQGYTKRNGRIRAITMEVCLEIAGSELAPVATQTPEPKPI